MENNTKEMLDTAFYKALSSLVNLREARDSILAIASECNQKMTIGNLLTAINLLEFFIFNKKNGIFKIMMDTTKSNQEDPNQMKLEDFLND